MTAMERGLIEIVEIKAEVKEVKTRRAEETEEQVQDHDLGLKTEIGEQNVAGETEGRDQKAEVLMVIDIVVEEGEDQRHENDEIEEKTINGMKTNGASEKRKVCHR